jgi:NAD(P)-dependent dehydrogenase (short-subunit alcohol dehydrogenase family)
MEDERKTAFVTGASRGIGAAIMQRLSAGGWRVIAHATADSAEFAAARRACGVADAVFADLAAPQAGGDAFAAALARAGRIDALINNAGVYEATPLRGPAGHWDDGFARTMAINVKAPADASRAAIAHFRDAGSGRIVNIASRAGHRGDGADYAAYAASKGALLAMTKTWARALSGENILLYALAPGWVETRMAPEDIEARRKAVAEIPLGRVAAPEEVAEMCAFLLSDACPSATGATFDINGASYVR